MDRVKFITHQGKEILFLNFSKSTADEALKVIEDAKRMVSTKPKNSILTLTDVTDARFNDAVSSGLKELTAHNKPYVKAAAIVGITGLKKILFSTVMAFSKRNIESFGNLDQAKSWLASN